MPPVMAREMITIASVPSTTAAADCRVARATKPSESAGRADQTRKTPTT